MKTLPSSKRVLMLGAGIVLSALGIALYYHSAFGSDPVSVFIDGLHQYFAVSYGTALNWFNAAVWVLIFLLARKEIRIGLICSLLFSGMILDVCTEMLTFIPNHGMLIEKIIWFGLGMLTLSLGAALSISSDLGTGPWDTVLVAVSKRLSVSFRYVRFFSDAFFALAGFLLGGVVGAGTVASVFVVGFLIDYFRSKLEVWKTGA